MLIRVWPSVMGRYGSELWRSILRAFGILHRQISRLILSYGYWGWEFSANRARRMLELPRALLDKGFLRRGGVVHFRNLLCGEGIFFVATMAMLVASGSPWAPILVNRLIRGFVRSISAPFPPRGCPHPPEDVLTPKRAGLNAAGALFVSRAQSERPIRYKPAYNLKPSAKAAG
jgi:hypothetical protein